MVAEVKRTILKNIGNIVGWKTPRKIVVIESDDWGSLRMPSKEIYNQLKLKGLDLESGGARIFNQYDSLETQADLNALFEILSKYKDKNGNHPVFTPLCVVANPDFDKIRASEFKQYHYENYTETIKKIPDCNNAYKLWLEGIKNRLFVPQFHGREHLNVAVWMKALQEKDTNAHLAFNQGIWGFNNHHPLNVSFLAAFDLVDPIEIEKQKLIIIDGLKIFEQLTGYKATYFVPPNGAINNSLETTAAKLGVKYMYGERFQHESLGQGKYKLHWHYQGQRNKNNQFYLSRNCNFETALNNRDWVDQCLSDINTAFRWSKPAIINSHRVNYIGAIDSKNRDNGIHKLEQLLKNIVKKWSDIEFMTSAELGELILQTKG